MPNTTFNTRISLKYDTYSNWTSQDPVLLAGEIAVVVVPAESGAVTQEPAILFKVGDGTSQFSTLQFSSGLAADVYDWAKASSKPTYVASEIEGLDAYISGKVQDTNTKYKIEVDKENPRKFTLSYQELNSEDWTVQNTITIPAETVYTLVEGTKNGTVNFNGTDVPVHGLGSAAYTEASAYDTSGSAAQALTDAKGYVDGKLGTIPENKTVVTMIQEAQEAATYDDTELDGRVTAVEGKATTLIGSDANKSVRTIANEELAAQLIPESAKDSLDTLAEIAAWIQEHPDDASAMNQAITALQNQLSGISAGSGTVKQYIDDAITALQIGDYAKASELTALAGRVQTLEGASHTHSNKTVLDAITSEKVSAWDGKAEANHEHDIADLNQASGYIILDCGSASVNI